MALPTGLADIMQKHGVGMGAADDAAPESEDGDSEMEHCISGLASAMKSGDEESMKSAIRDLVDCIKNDDSEQDEQE